MNKIQFSVVREDYLVEEKLIELFALKKILLIASGGCTALSLQAIHPKLEISLFDINRAQLNLIKNKVECLQNGDLKKIKRTLNVGNNSRDGLNACGNFEKLFRSFSGFVKEFILDEDKIKYVLKSNDELADKYLTHLINDPYWNTAFNMFFCDSLLLTMFGKDAIQYAEPGSYPKYFKAKLENGLLRHDRINNYFLHHIFLGCYFDNIDSLPPYCYNYDNIRPMNMFESHLRGIKNLHDFDMIGLSNIFDWQNINQIEETFLILANNLKSGTIVLYRQLNNSNDYERFYSKKFERNKELGDFLLQNDRSLFYEKIVVLKKV